MKLRPIWFFTIALTTVGTVSEEYVHLEKEAVGILAEQAETAEESFVRLDAGLALLPYRPDKAIPLVLEELESGEIDYAFEKKAADSLTRYLSRDVIRKVRRILKKKPQTRWAVRLITQVGDPDDLRLIEPYFLDAASDPALIPLLAVYQKDAQGILSELLHYSALKSCIAAELLMGMGITDYRDVIERYAENNLCMLMVLAGVDGKRALEIAAGYLKSEDIRRRRTAAANLYRLNDPAYIPYLVYLLDDEDAETACYAAYSLGFLDDTSGARLLRETAQDTQTAGGETSRKLFCKLPPSLIEPVLYPFLASDFGQPTRTSIEAVGILADTGAVGYLFRFLTDADTALQKLALEALGRIDAPSTAEYVYPFLESDYYQLKEAAIKALGRMNDTSIVERLNLMLFWEPSIEGLMIRHTIMEALAMTGSRKAFPALAAVLDDADPYLALKILSYLPRAEDPAYVPYVEPFLTDTLPPLQIRAAAAVLALSGNH